MRIEVTESDIANGRRKSDLSCPVALAIKRQVPGAKDVHAHPDGIFIGNDFYYTSIRAARFMFRFDDQKPVTPFRFQLRI